MGGGIYPALGIFLLGGDIRGPAVRLRVVGHVGGDGEADVGNSCRIPKEDNK